MKKLIYLLLLTLVNILACREDDGMVPEPPVPPVVPCEELECEHSDEFYGKAIMNGECWRTEWTFFQRVPSGMSFVLGRYAGGGIGEQLRFFIFPNTELSDTIQLCSPDSSDPPPGQALAIYGYEELDASAGRFRFVNGAPPTGNDYLLLDYINEDTTIIEGRFQVRFPERLVNSYVNAPDTMRLECGSFRVELF